jgi:hypothetical protein
MARPYLAVTLLFLLPVVVFVGGARIMSTVSGRHTDNDQKPLNQRLGYDTEVVARYWGALDGAAGPQRRGNGRVPAVPRAPLTQVAFGAVQQRVAPDERSCASPDAARG